jgi:diacylglycerol kinase (ATP)
MLSMATSTASTAYAVSPAAVQRRRSPAPIGGPNLLLVANGNASGVNGHADIVARVAALLRGRGARVDWAWTTSPAEFDALVSEEERRIVLLGGDGTLHAVANVHGHTPEVALLPLGRANNVARALRVPFDLAAATALAVDGDAHPVDGIALDAPGLAMTAVEGVSIGFHAQARARYRAVNSADTVAGVAAALGALARFEPVVVALDVDGTLEVRRVGQLFVANFPFFGPGLPVAPGADPTDGALELVEIEADGRFSLAARLARLRRGTHLRDNGVRARSARRLRIAICGRSPVVADTTVFRSSPVELAVRPHAIQLVAPPAS